MEQSSRIYALVKTHVDFQSIIPSCIAIAREVEQVRGLKGPEKLKLLQDVLRLALHDQPLGLAEKEKLVVVIDTVVPLAIQAAILASKSPIVKHVQEVCLSCCWTKT